MSALDEAVAGNGEAPTLLDRAAILSATSAATPAAEVVLIPELGGRVRIREMNGALRNRIEAAMVKVRTGGDSKLLERTTAQMIAMCVVDADDRPILQEADARQLFARNPRAAFRIREVVFRLSALDEEDAEALAEGFGDGQSGDSISG